MDSEYATFKKIRTKGIKDISEIVMSNIEDLMTNLLKCRMEFVRENNLLEKIMTECFNDETITTIEQFEKKSAERVNYYMHDFENDVIVPKMKDYWNEKGREYILGKTKEDKPKRKRTKNVLQK